MERIGEGREVAATSMTCKEKRSERVRRFSISASVMRIGWLVTIVCCPLFAVREGQFNAPDLWFG
jgi:hypothetical protein